MKNIISLFVIPLGSSLLFVKLDLWQAVAVFVFVVGWVLWLALWLDGKIENVLLTKREPDEN